jgi:hypothetical protein
MVPVPKWHKAHASDHAATVNSYKVQSENANLLNSVNIFHQNIRGLRNKSDKFLYSSEIYGINPHILCISKHHMIEQDMIHLTLPGYLLGPKYCRLDL